MRNRIVITLLLVGIGTGNVFANSSGWSLSLGHALKTDKNQGFHARYRGAFDDDIVSGQIDRIKLTPAQKQEAAAWHLNEKEEQRYVALMQNRSGHYYDKLRGVDATPVEVLGFNARTDAERQKYAKLAAQQAFEHLAKYLAFLSAYGEQARALKAAMQLPVIRPFNYAKYSPYHYAPVAMEAGDQFVLTVGLHEEVTPIVAWFLKKLPSVSGTSLTIHLVGKKLTQTQIDAWAAAQSIPPSWVGRGKQIQFSVDATPPAGHALPLLIRVRHGQQTVLKTGGF